MFQDLIGSFGIEVDTDDRNQIAMAIASSGVLRAELLDETLPTDHDELHRLLTALLRGRPLTPWRLRPARGNQQPPVTRLPASILARLWNDVIVKTNGARLAIEIDPGIPLRKALPSVRGLAHQLLGHLPGLDGWSPPTTGVSSVVVPRSLPGDWKWGWPLRIGILPGKDTAKKAARLRSTNMIQRNLATLTVLGGNETECDLLITSSPMPELHSRLCSMELKTGAVVSLTEKPVGVRDLSRSVEDLHRILEAGAFVSGVAPATLEGLWINALVRSVSHNLPFDVAVWQADAAVRQQSGEGELLFPPPTLIADPEFLQRSTLDQIVVNLADRIEALRTVSWLRVSSDTALRLGVGKGMHRTEDLAQALRHNANMIHFSHEWDGSEGVAELVQTVTAAESPPVRTLYADLTFYDETRTKRVKDTEPLVEQRIYQLEVALRRNRTGMSYRGEPPKTVAPPPAGVEVELLAVVSVRDQDFDVPEQVQPIRLPARVDADSEINAIFQITPRRRTTDAANLAEIEVRIYYELNLIEHLVLKAAVLGVNDNFLYSGLGSTPIFVEQIDKINRSYRNIVRDLQPRQMSIDVRRVADVYRFNVTVRDNSRQASASGGHTVLLHARSEISPAELARRLNQTRALWEKLAMETYVDVLEGKEPVFRDSILKLAQAGRDLWSLLFRGVQDSAMWHIGEWLKKHPPAEGAVIEIKLLDGTTSFVFPWSLLYDHPIPRSGSAPADPDGFWGLRYSIEQKPANGPYTPEQPVDPGPEGLRLAFMVWERFRNAPDQRLMLEQLARDSGGRLSVTSPPVNDPESFYDIVEEGDADILYFFTHGYTRPPEADSAYSDLKRFRQRYEKLRDDAPAKAEQKSFYNFIKDPDFMPDQSCIALSLGRVFLHELEAAPVRLKDSTIVILNMCQSAQVLPGISESFVGFFLGRKARSVIGTECSMTSKFAHPFSERLLRELLEGQPLGEALRRARRHFINLRNPLGLAYTLFGSAVTRYNPAVLTAPSTPQTP